MGVRKSLLAKLMRELSPGHRGNLFILTAATYRRSYLNLKCLIMRRGGFLLGAIEKKRARLEVAHGGTVYLDEKGDLHPSNHGKLLLIMETGYSLDLAKRRSSKQLLE